MVQAQRYISKFPPYFVFQAGTRGGEEAVLEFAGDLFGLREWSRSASWTIKKKTQRGCLRREKKEKKNMWERKKNYPYCVRDLNT